jgi:hypothetical protein
LVLKVFGTKLVLAVVAFATSLVLADVALHAAEIVSTYHVPVPASEAERLRPWSTMPVDAHFRVRLDRDEAVLKYSLPGHLTGSRSLGLKLTTNLEGRRHFEEGTELILTGPMEALSNPALEDDPNGRAHASCIFGSESVVSCTVAYSSISLDPVAQERWLAAREWPPADRAGFAEVAAILGHEAIGVVRTNVELRGETMDDEGYSSDSPQNP